MPLQKGLWLALGEVYFSLILAIWARFGRIFHRNQKRGILRGFLALAEIPKREKGLEMGLFGFRAGTH